LPNIKRIRIAWIWVFFVVLALFLLSSNFGKRRNWNPAEQFVVETTAPLQRLIKETVRYTEYFWLKYFNLINVRNENERLKKQVGLLRMENDRYRELLTSTRRLQKLLQFKESIDWPVLAVQVIGRDPTNLFESVIIDKGSNAGLKMNMPVVNASGVVGRLVSVSRHYAKVLLIIDQNSAVDCFVQRSREKGVVKGLTSKLCKLDYVVKTGDVKEGDRVVTSGLGRVFPKGLPVGVVTQVSGVRGELFKEIKVRPMADFSKLEELLVILKEDPLLKDQGEKG